MNKLTIKFIPLLKHGEEKEFNNEKELKDYFGYACLPDDYIYSRQLNTYLTIVSSGFSNEENKHIIGALYIDDPGDLFNIYVFDDQYHSCLEGNGYFELVDQEFNIIDILTSEKLYDEYNNSNKADRQAFRIKYPFVIWYNK